MSINVQGFCIVICALVIITHQQPNKAPLQHKWLSRKERSALFGSKVLKYELVYLPVWDGRKTVRSRRQKRSEDIQDFQDFQQDQDACSPFTLKVAAFGKSLTVDLRPNENLIRDPLLVVSRTVNATFVEPGLTRLNGSCYFHGDIANSPGGRAALSLHQGFTGIIAPVVGDHWVLQPAPRRLRTRNAYDVKVPHIVYKMENSQNGGCAQPPSEGPSTTSGQHDTRQKRAFYTGHSPVSSTNHLTIETAVFVDRDMYTLMKQSFPADPDRGIVEVVLAMINAAQLLFQDQSLGANMEIALVRLEIQKTEFEGLQRSASIDQYLKNFCSWQKQVNPANDNDPLHWDHAILLTGSNLYSEDTDGNRNSQVVGLAPVSGMCLLGNSCTVNEGGHFEAVYVIAHEMGHSMGMQHDGPQNRNRCDKNKYIMSPTLGSGKTTWSTCSRDYLVKFLRSAQSRCLWDPGTTPDSLNHQRNTLLPGQRFNADQQCRLKFGPGSARDPSQDLENICGDLRCLANNYPLTSHPALEGSFCGEGKHCRGGNCVVRPVETPVRPISGGWGPWTIYGPCASSCLAGRDGQLTSGSSGVMISSRRCDRPLPQHGGKECVGKDHRYKLCYTPQLCSTSSVITCDQYATRVCSAAATIDGQLTGIGQKMDNTNAENSCSVWCNKFAGGRISRGWKFPDGTSCTLKGSPKGLRNTYCVQGICQEFDCQSQTARLEKCESDASKLESNDDGTDFSRSSNPIITGGDWEATSTCMYGCVQGKGIRTVKKKCTAPNSSSDCSEVEQVQLCDSYRKCMSLQTTSEYASQVCADLRKTYPHLSGIGEQMQPLLYDQHLPCYVACQDVVDNSKYYKIDHIERGLFRVGTDCTFDRSSAAFCLQGRCLNFGDDGFAIHGTAPRFRKRSAYFAETFPFGHGSTSKWEENYFPDETVPEPMQTIQNFPKILSSKNATRQVISFAEYLSQINKTHNLKPLNE